MDRALRGNRLTRHRRPERAGPGMTRLPPKETRSPIHGRKRLGKKRLTKDYIKGQNYKKDMDIDVLKETRGYKKGGKV